MNEHLIEVEIRSIVESSTFDKGALLMLLKELSKPPQTSAPRPRRIQHAPVKQYTEIQKNYTCLHCGSQWVTVMRLKEKEETIVITKEGECMIVNSKSSASIDCISGTCSRCPDFISRMSREELETRYMALLNRAGIGSIMQEKEGRIVKL